MAAAAPTRIEADVRYRKWLGFWDRWNVGSRNAASDPYFQGGEIHVRAGSGPHQIVFHLNAGGKLDWAADPIWVQAGSCPQSASHNPQITSPVVDPASRTLTITDDPAAQCELHYSLNFVKPNGRPKRYDPIIIHD